MKDIVDFIETYFELYPGVPVRLYQYQKDILSCKANFRIILKARQVGISSVIAWEALAYSLLKKNHTTLFVSVADRQAKELLNYVYRVLNNLRLKENIVLLEETKDRITFENGSRIISLPNNPNTVQGFRADRIYLDEFALYENDKKMLEAILPSISHGGAVTIISRPMGRRGEFYRLWMEAKAGKNEFVPFEIPYTACKAEKYQEMIQRIRKTMDELTFREAYCCEFVDESASFFPYELLLPCIDENLASPRPGMNLRFGIDFGRKINSTVITIAEVSDIYLIRELKEFTGVSYSSQLDYIGRKIIELNPEVVYVDEFGVGVRLTEELREKFGSKIVPVGLTNEMKEKLLSDLRILFEDKKIRIPRNDKLLQQLHALQRKVSGGYIKWEPGKTEDYGKHDDYVWSLALAVAKQAVPQLRYFKAGEESPSAKGYMPEFKETLLGEEEEE